MNILRAIGFFLLGVLGVGLPTIRTLNVIKGKYLLVIPISLIASVNMIVFTWLIVDKNWTFIIFNSLGAACSVSYIAYREGKNKAK